MSLQTAIAAVQTLVGAVSGIRSAPEYPPEQVNVFPFCVAYAGPGTWNFGAAGDKALLGSIVCEVHISKAADLPRTVKAAMAFSDTVPNHIMKHPTLNGNADCFGSITFTFGTLGYAGVETIGFRFTLQNVKLQTLIT